MLGSLLAENACRYRLPGKAAEQRVGESMEHHVAIGMGDDTAIMGHRDTAQHDMITRPEDMHVETGRHARDQFALWTETNLKPAVSRPPPHGRH